MRPPTPMPLQLRLHAFTVTTLICLALWAPFSAGLFAYAAEIPIASQPLDQYAPTAAGHIIQHGDADAGIDGIEGYVPEFALFDRSLTGRQPVDAQSLENNVVQKADINPGGTVYFVLPRLQSRIRRSNDVSLRALDAQGIDNASGQVAHEDTPAVDGSDQVHNEETNHELRKRQASSHVWISANTCRQPMPRGNTTKMPANHPDLVMYISTSSQNQKPGPNLAPGTIPVVFDKGYAIFDINATSDIYIGISAPNLDKDWFGSWQFELAASLDGPYHGFNDSSPFLFMIDTDSDSALFITEDIGTSNATQSVDNLRNNNPFQMYAFAAGNYTAITGLEQSYCALKEQFNANSTKNFTITSSITTKYLSKFPRSQFHVKNLDAATTYNGFVVVDENNLQDLPGVGTVRGGGKVFKSFNWTTKADDSCQILFDLKFCDSVAYAVPSSPEFKLNDSGLGKIYDELAQAYYLNFTRSLSQIACETTAESRYSLARSCKDCADDYKNWLCSVLIPRCEDWNAPGDWLQPRRINNLTSDGTMTYGGNITQEFNNTYRNRFSYNQSRNPMIDQLINPGPYKEMLPCEDTCFDIVRSCPAQLGFSCPNNPGKNLSYGKRDPNDKYTLKCNFQGAVVNLNVQSKASTFSTGLKCLMVAAVLVAVCI